MRVLITGISGFVGRHLAAILRDRDDVVLIGADIAGGEEIKPNCDIFLKCDFRRKEMVDTVLAESKPDWIFHLAGIFSGEMDQLIRTNTLGSVALFDAVLARVPRAKVLVVGSAAEYGPPDEFAHPILESHHCRPISLYGISKLAATQTALNYAESRSLQAVVVRPFNLVGPGIRESLVVGAVIERIIAAHARGERKIKVGNLDAQRDFLDVRDAVRAYVKLLEGNFIGQIFNICSGRPVRIGNVVDSVIRISGKGMITETDPALIRQVDLSAVYGNCDKARAAIAFETSLTLDDSLRDAWDYAINARTK